MTLLETFTKTTMSVIQEDGLDGYLPTVILPATQDVRTIEDIPEGADHREAIQSYIVRHGLNKGEFLFSVQSNKNEITTGYFTGSGTSFMTILGTEAGYVVAPLSSCNWWHVEP